MNRYHDGLMAYCKYCCKTHANWHPLEDYLDGETLWECGCGSGLLDSNMDIENGQTRDGKYLHLNLRNRIRVSDEAEAYKDQVNLILNTTGILPVTSDVKVFIDLYRPQNSGDLDNLRIDLKVTLDSLNQRVYTDDKQIVEIHARRFDDKFNPRIEVRIEVIS